MMPILRRLFAALAATAVLAVGVPAAGASVIPTSWPSWFSGPGSAVVTLPTGVGADSCGLTTVGQGQSGPGTTHNQVCLGAGLSFIGPSIGQIATVIGPTIIGPTVVGNLIVSAGPVATGP